MKAMGDGGSVMKKNWKKKMQKGGYFFWVGWGILQYGGGGKEYVKKKKT